MEWTLQGWGFPLSRPTQKPKVSGTALTTMSRPCLSDPGSGFETSVFPFCFYFSQSVRQGRSGGLTSLPGGEIPQWLNRCGISDIAQPSKMLGNRIFII